MITVVRVRVEVRVRVRVRARARVRVRVRVPVGDQSKQVIRSLWPFDVFRNKKKDETKTRRGKTQD